MSNDPMTYIVFGVEAARFLFLIPKTLLTQKDTATIIMVP